MNTFYIISPHFRLYVAERVAIGSHNDSDGDAAFIDLRTAQVYCDPSFLVSQEEYLNFHHFCV